MPKYICGKACAKRSIVNGKKSRLKMIKHVPYAWRHGEEENAGSIVNDTKSELTATLVNWSQLRCTQSRHQC